MKRTGDKYVWELLVTELQLCDSLWVTDGAQKCVFLTLNLHQPILTNIKQIYSVKICIFLHII